MLAEVPDEFWLGVEQFNRQEFYACHDTLEAIWLETFGPNKQFYQGILQIAVACYHLGNRNWRGAVMLLGDGIRRLREYQPTYEGVDVSELINESWQLLQALQESEPESIVEFVAQLETSGAVNRLPKIRRIGE